MVYPMRPLATVVLPVLLATLLSACAGQVQPPPQARLETERIDRAALLAHSPLDRGQAPAAPGAADILGLSPEMKSFLDGYRMAEKDEQSRLRLLIFAVMVDGGVTLVYDDKTRTAAETFRDQRGNCLSFTSMFVAMARYVGLDASYQEVEVPPDWSMSGQAFLLSRHVNVRIRLSTGDARVVDFNLYDFDFKHKRRMISDRRGRAHYFNNLGAEFMLAGDTPRALAHLRQALREDDGFGPAWVNLGILHRREALPDYAEAAFLQALQDDPADLVAMSNLASLYEEQGMLEVAAEYRALVQRHREKNPYYHYMLAREAFVSGDYLTAAANLERAIRERQDEDLFLALMSMTQLMLGDERAAREWMRKAEEAASEDEDKQRYQHKLDALLGLGGRH